eukprot:maker-scaffold392_size185621-snap-gene-0.20 protein:Tk05910 transcript:maker-scaffold392_size185621-snap-gene-0.20-mRNA-1 annotation:"abhydrolase domain-containing protein 14b"
MTTWKGESDHAGSGHSGAMPLIHWNIKSGTLALSLLGLCILFLGFISPPSVMFTEIAWKDVDFLAEVIPPKVLNHVQDHPSVDIRERTTDINGLNLFYREIMPGSVLEPSGQTVLLLHGHAFQSSTWQNEVPTLQTLSAMGHRAIAIDLPGYGNTPAAQVNQVAFMEQVITTLSPDTAPVLISPSMSGSYSLPLLMKQPKLICGFIPVAPTGTNGFTSDQYKSVATPTLIVRGERDTAMGKTSAQHLSQIPTSSQPQVLPKARHPCYLDDPDRWHQLIFNFMTVLKSHC